MVKQMLWYSNTRKKSALVKLLQENRGKSGLVVAETGRFSMMMGPVGKS